MYTHYDSELLLRQLESLLTHPREDLNIEIKGWLNLNNEEHKANLAQAILALANSGGGYILIGYVQVGTDYVPANPRPIHLETYSHDAVNSIVRLYADPPFHCSVHYPRHPQTGEVFPVIQVPGNHSVPIRAKRDGPNMKHVRVNAYYIRRPGPTSEPIQTAQEWDDLLHRCLLARKNELFDGIRTILFGMPTRPLPIVDPARESLDDWVLQSRASWSAAVRNRLGENGFEPYQYGVWTVAYQVTGDFQHPSLSQLLRLLREVEGNETGWPVWLVPSREEIKPYPNEGVIDCLMAEKSSSDGAHSDYWRASPEGRLYLLRGYQDDTDAAQRLGISPGTYLDMVLPIWRVGECLLHAHRLASKLAGQSARILIRFTWEGLTNRLLSNWACGERNLPEGYRCHQDAVQSETTLVVVNVPDQLPEIVKKLTEPLYEAFDFFEMPMHVIKEELKRMTRGHS